MPENGFEEPIMSESLLPSDVVADPLQDIIDAHHFLLSTWGREQSDQVWSQYEAFVNFVWEFALQSDEAPRLYTMMAQSPDANDRLIASVCLPALMPRAPTAAFDLRSVLVEDESEPVRRNAQDAVARAKQEGTLTSEAEALFAAVVLLRDYRNRLRPTVLFSGRK